PGDPADGGGAGLRRCGGRARGCRLLARGHGQPTPFVAPLLDALDISKYFSVVIGGDDVQNKKPHPDPLLLVASKLGIAPEQLL
ncbi:HAD hydrolase-like protein, partial [Xanthomonas citri pv. citri]|nr:HAD hydrolase-like protein [Xanthomonas citri pv. citri]